MSNYLYFHFTVQVTFNETDIFSPGKFRLVYFSAGVKDILGVSDVFTVRYQN